MINPLQCTDLVGRCPTFLSGNIGSESVCTIQYLLHRKLLQETGKQHSQKSISCPYSICCPDFYPATLNPLSIMKQKGSLTSAGYTDHVEIKFFWQKAGRFTHRLRKAKPLLQSLKLFIIDF